MSNIFNMTDVWNNGSTVFTAVKMNATDTASDPSSLLMDLQVGGVSKSNFSKTGKLSILGWPVIHSDNGGATHLVNGNYTNGNGIAFSASNFGLRNDIGLSWYNTDPSGTIDLRLMRDAANTLAQRNGTAAQTFNLYNTYTDASNYERGVVSWSGNFLTVGTQSAGTGVSRSMGLIANSIYFQINGAGNVLLLNSGSLSPTSANATDLGGVGSEYRYIRASSAIQTKALTVATLPAAATAGAGARSFVTDATVTAAGNFGATVAGGGTNKVPVWTDGTSWFIG